MFPTQVKLIVVFPCRLNARKRLQRRGVVTFGTTDDTDDFDAKAEGDIELQQTRRLENTGTMFMSDAGVGIPPCSSLQLDLIQSVIWQGSARESSSILIIGKPEISEGEPQTTVRRISLIEF